jgi:succinyl-diaminopimelate desuccinylase
MDKDQVRRDLDDLRQEHIKLLQGFTQRPSPNPPGDTKAAVQFLADFLSKQGIPFSLYAPKDELPNIVATFQGDEEGSADDQGPHIVFNGHVDVFPAGKEEDWERDPWSGFNDGTYIHGRGTVDMKSGTAALLLAYVYLYKHRNVLKGRVTLTLVSDEETGGKWGTKWLLENRGEECRGDVCLNGEPGGLESIRFGEKGTLRVTIKIETVGANGTYLNLSEGANRIGVRLCHELTTAIEALKPDLPEDLANYLRRRDVCKVIDEIMGKDAHTLSLKPTVNIGMWHGGFKVNVLPPSAEIQLDIRLPIGMQRDQVLSEMDANLKRFPEATMQVQEAASNPSNLCSSSHPLLHSLAKHAKVVTGREPVAIPGLGGTDAKHWRYAGIPAYTYGLSPVSMGATNERVSISEYCTLIHVYILAVQDYLCS